MDILFSLISVQTFWKISLFLHFVVAVALVAAITLQAALVLAPAPQPAGASETGLRPLLLSAPSATLIAILYLLQILLGAWVYVRYRTYVRIPMEGLRHWWTVGAFEVKEHVITMGLAARSCFGSVCHHSQVVDGLLDVLGVVWNCGRPRRERFPRGRIMTQALDINERVAYREGACPPTAAPQVRDTTNVDKLAVFVITFGIAYAILYTFFERWNWPLFTYHPAINRLDLFKAPGIPEDGPPMFWYGWVVLSGIAATVVGAIATAISTQWLQRATVFFCVMAGLWPIFYALAAVIDQEASFNAEFLRSVWTPGVPALVGAMAATYLVPIERAKRIWTSWLLIMPIGGLVILSYSLKEYFLR
jgi:hypothetical protein